MGKVLQAKESFVTEVNGKRTTVVAGQTRVDEDNELASRYPDYFEAIKANYGVEDMSAAPGEVRTRLAAAQEDQSSEASSEPEKEPEPESAPAPKGRRSTTQAK